jgi:hypothetical protein
LQQGLLHLKPADPPGVEDDQEGTKSNRTWFWALGTEEELMTREGEKGQDSLNPEVIHCHTSIINVQESFIAMPC